MNLTPASSRDLPSEAIFTRVSESGTRLMQTAIFIERSAVMVRHQTSDVRAAASHKPQAVHSPRRAGKQTWRLSSGNRLRRTACGLRLCFLSRQELDEDAVELRD